jgi:hypothetical protein
MRRTGSKLQQRRQKSIEGLSLAFENANAAADSGEDSVPNSATASSPSFGVSRTRTTGVWLRSLFQSEQTRVRKNFIKEMRILNGLRHPCVAQIVGAVLHPEPLMIMVRICAMVVHVDSCLPRCSR